MTERNPKMTPYACGDRTTRAALLVTYSVSHFCVDLACAMLVLGSAVPLVREIYPDTGIELAAMTIILYNMMAFVFQLPIGAIADRLDDNPKMSAYGCVTVAAAYLVTLINPILAAFVAGIGNAMFHVGGGIDTLNIAGTKRADLPGVFVSTGAIGLFCGINWADLALPMPELPIALMCICGMSLVMVRHFVIRRGTRMPNATPEPEFRGMPRPVLMVLAGMFVTVVIRSLLGTVVAFPWKTGLVLGFVNVLCIAGGKALGGIVGDRLGWKRTAIASLPVASVLFLFSYDNMPLGLLAMLLFNMTMPLTLTVLADTFRHNRGAAFGTTTVALFLGAMFTGIPFLSTSAGVALMSFVSFITIMIGFKGYDATLGRLRFIDGKWTSLERASDENNDKTQDTSANSMLGDEDITTKGNEKSPDMPDDETDKTSSATDEQGGHDAASGTLDDNEPSHEEPLREEPVE